MLKHVRCKAYKAYGAFFVQSIFICHKTGPCSRLWSYCVRHVMYGLLVIVHNKRTATPTRHNNRQYVVQYMTVLCLIIDK